MVLLGIALVFLFNALLALLQYIASEQALQQVVFWTLGSLTKADWPKLGARRRRARGGRAAAAPAQPGS